MKHLLLLAALLSSFSTFANDKGGNGGGVHVCSDGSVAMYDIYEGYTRYNFEFPSPNLAVDHYIERGLAKMRNQVPRFSALVAKELDYLKTHVLLRRNIVLTPIDDANILVVNEGCHYGQLANWDEMSGNVMVKKELYSSLDNLSIAGLYLHEAIYKVLRTTANATTSDKARRLVADILSTAIQLRDTDVWKSVSPNEIKVIKLARPSDLTVLHDAKTDRHNVTYHTGDLNLSEEEQKNLKFNVVIKSPEIDAIRDELSAADNAYAEVTTKLWAARTAIFNMKSNEARRYRPQVIVPLEKKQSASLDLRNSVKAKLSLYPRSGKQDTNISAMNSGYEHGSSSKNDTDHDIAYEVYAEIILDGVVLETLKFQSFYPKKSETGAFRFEITQNPVPVF